jgi:hypothetical protein
MVLPKCWQMLAIALLCSCIAVSRAYLGTPTRSVAFKVCHSSYVPTVVSCCNDSSIVTLVHQSLQMLLCMLPILVMFFFSTYVI